MSETIPSVTYSRPCCWCAMYRPGKAPNYVTVSVPKSDGLCAACGDLMTARIRQRAQERAALCSGPTGPCVHPDGIGHEGDHVRQEAK